MNRNCTKEAIQVTNKQMEKSSETTNPRTSVIKIALRQHTERVIVKAA